MKAIKGNARQFVISLCVIGALGLVGILLLRQSPSEAQAAPTPAPNDQALAVSDAGRKMLNIQTAPARAQTLNNDLQATGLIAYPADQTVKICPRVQGRIRQVFVHVGDRVAPGQPLAILESSDAAAAQTTYIQDENKLRLAKSNLEREERLYRLGTPDVTQAQANLDQARAHTKFTRDALDKIREQARIGGFTQKPVEDAENTAVAAGSALAQAQADLALAQKDYDRKAKLVAIGVAAKSDLEASENVLEKAQVSVDADQKQVGLARQALDRERKAFKSNLYADQQVRSAENDYEQGLLQEQLADRALRLSKAAVLRDLEQAHSDYQAAQADDANARRNLALLGQPDPDGSLRITAPIAGVVVERDVNPGQVVDQSQSAPWQMFVISNPDQVWVDADVYEKDIRSITVGQPVQMRVAALPNRLFNGHVLHIAPTLDTKSRAIKIRSEIANPGGQLKDGMFADVTIDRPQGQAVTVVPLEAVQHDGDDDYVYVAQSGKYAKRKVTCGAQRDGLCVVLDGLKPAEIVVTHGALFLGEQNSDN